MPHNDHQRTRRCIAKTRSGSQCKNSINCSHHRCNDPDCAEEVLHTRRDIPLTPLSIHQEYLTSPRSCRTNTSRSPNSSGRRDTITVPPRPDRMQNQNEAHRQNALPIDSLRVSEGYETDNDDEQGASGLGHVQPGLIKHESLDVHSRGPSVQIPLISSEDMRVRHGKYDIAGPSRARQPIRRSGQPSNGESTPLVDPPLDDGKMTSPILDPTLPDPNLDVGVTAKGKEKERRYSNGRDNITTEYPASTSVADLRGIDPTLPEANPEASVTAKSKDRERRYSNRQDSGYPASNSIAGSRDIVAGPIPEAGVTAKGKEKKGRHSNGQDSGYPASTLVTNLKDIDPILPSANPEPGVTAKGNEKERKHSDCLHCTGCPALTAEDYAREIDANLDKLAAYDDIINDFRGYKTATLEANDKLIAAQTKAKILEEAHYDSEPSLTPLPPSQASTRSSPPNPGQVSSPAPEMTQSLDTVHGISVAQMETAEIQATTLDEVHHRSDPSLTPLPPSRTSTPSSQSSTLPSTPNPTQVSSPAPEMTQSPDTIHGISVAQMEAAETQEGTLEDAHYNSEPSPRSLPPSRSPTPSSQTSTRSSTPDPDRINSPAPEMTHSEATAHGFDVVQLFREHARRMNSSQKEVLVTAFENAVMGRPAPEITQFPDTAHGIDVVQHIRELARRMNSSQKEVLVAAFKAAVMGRD